MGDNDSAAEGLKTALIEAAASLGAPDAQVRLERPKDPEHGDVTSNVAMTLAKRLGKSPRDIAESMAEAVRALPGVTSVDVAGPGFLNVRFDSVELGQVVERIRQEDQAWGRGSEGEGKRIMVEFVSANPTGPLHLGHGRQAALGDGIAALLEWTGWDVHREFYFNDAGSQMDRLASSVWARYQQTFGHELDLPEGGYQGEYVGEIAETFKEEYGDRFDSGGADPEPALWDEGLVLMRDHAVAALRQEQVRDLEGFGVHFDEFYRESSLYDDGRLESTIQALAATGLTYDKDGAVWLKTSDFGDQKDRVMVKSDGSPTYFLPDVAYHTAKWDRGFQDVINVQGSDHHGTVDRVRAGLQALGRPRDYPEYVLHQMVTVERGGQVVRFSKRAGSYDTMGELVDQVGVDVARYFFLMRRPEAHLKFDLDVALDQSDKNPVYKVQYAHARMCSIFAKAREQGWDGDLATADASLLKTPHERELLKQLAEFPGTVSRAARDRAPHIVCDYLEKTAGMVNSWYHAGNPSRSPELAVLVEDRRLSTARLALSDSVRIVLRNGLTLLGISVPERMDRAS